MHPSLLVDTTHQNFIVKRAHALRPLILTASATLGVLWSLDAHAQDEPVAAPAEADMAPEEAPADTDAETEAAAEETPPPAVEPEPEPEPMRETEAAEAPLVLTEEKEPAEEANEPFKPTFTVGAGLRTGLNMNLSGDNSGQLSLYDALVDQVHVRPYMGGSLTPHVGYWVQFEIGTANGLGNFALLDGIAQIKFIDEVQLWVGQHIPANDRNNMNGPFFGNGWNFAIAVEEYPFDVGARDRGATLWGLIAGGHIKYHASIVDLQPGRDIGKARGAGRITVHFWEPENFYYNSGTYFGEQDVLTVGAVVQGQKGVDGDDSDLFGYSFDGMMEKNFGGGGTLTLEAGYWNYRKTGAGYVVNQYTIDSGLGVAGPYPGEAVLGMVSWLTPNKIGAGKIQPNFRVQYADWAPESRLVFDAGIAYVIDGFNHKYHLNYRHAESDPAGGDKIKSDSIQVGFQYLMGL